MSKRFIFRKLISTITKKEVDFNSLEEYSQDGESLEVYYKLNKKPKIKKGNYIWQRFADFLPFEEMSSDLSLGEGNTPLLFDKNLAKYTGIDNLLIKNETQNPTSSFKDRGSLTISFLAKEKKEKILSTISTGNMGHSTAAYAAKANLKCIVFVPYFCPNEKLIPMVIHGAKIIKIKTNDYSNLKIKLLKITKSLGIRLTSGNNPFRVEGYKLTAFELFEQLRGKVPDYIAVPVSACGHIRGIFKGFLELYEAKLINKLPKMIVVQAKNNSPIVSAIKKNLNHLIPFKKFHTIAEAITSGNPPGGNEIVIKAKKYQWLAQDVSEKNIYKSKFILAKAGYFVEFASATCLQALKDLRTQGKIKKKDIVIMILTGSGLKDINYLKTPKRDILEIEEKELYDKILEVIK